MLGIYIYIYWNFLTFFVCFHPIQEEIDKIVENAEMMTGNIQSLKKKIQILANEVEEEEQKVKHF